MQRCEWLHACAPRVYLFDWFRCLAAAYVSVPHRPPLIHFLRHGAYFSSSSTGTSGSKKRAKRQKVDAAPADPAMLRCVESVLRCVLDEWHTPQLSWIVQSRQDNAPQCQWPEFAGKFDSAALLRDGCWQPFLQATMDNSSQECSTLDIGASAHPLHAARQSCPPDILFMRNRVAYTALSSRRRW